MHELVTRHSTEAAPDPHSFDITATEGRGIDHQTATHREAADLLTERVGADLLVQRGRAQDGSAIMALTKELAERLDAHAWRTRSVRGCGLLAGWCGRCM